MVASGTKVFHSGHLDVSTIASYTAEAGALISDSANTLKYPPDGMAGVAKGVVDLGMIMGLSQLCEMTLLAEVLSVEEDETLISHSLVDRQKQRGI